MSKLVFWIVVVVGVLLGVRLLNAAKARRRREAPRTATGKAAGATEPMVRCARCGVYLPRADALPVAAGFTCGDARCTPSP